VNPARLSAALLVAACARPAPVAAPRPVVVTEVPGTRDVAAFEPRTRYPDGSRVAVVDLARPDAASRVLSQGLVAAGGASVRWDGARVAFVAKERAEDRFAVFTCAPDGSGRVKAAEGVADCGSAAFLADGRLVYSAETSDASWAIFTTGEAGGPPRRITFSGGADVDPTPLRDGRVAFASRAPGATEFRLLAVHVDGTGVGPVLGGQRTRALLNDAPVALAPVAKPQGHLSVVDEAKSWGDLFCVDARAPGAASAKRVRLVRLGAVERPIGDVPLEADGSFFVRVPVDAPLGLELLDDDGRVVAAQHAPFWVRPGETRGCIGCHEDADTAPPNVRPLAVLAPPVALGVASSRRVAR
jgi:hypothetical protein